MKKGNGKIFARILSAAGVILFAVVTILPLLAVSELNTEYLALKGTELSEGARAVLAYEDHLHASIGSAVEIGRGDAGVELREFTANALRAIDQRILSCGILYAMMVVTVFAYPLWRRFGHDGRKHVLSAAAAVLIAYAVYAGSILLTHAALRLPFFFPEAYGWLFAAVGLLAVIGGSCFLAWLLRTVGCRKILAAAAIPLVFLLFLFGASFEGQLYAPPTVDSFAYLSEIDEHVFDEGYDGEVYYDEEKNVVVLNGKEYEPEKAENTEYLKGAARIGAFVFEALSPYSGSSLFLIDEAMRFEGFETTISPVILLAYAVKAVGWIVLPLLLGKKRRYTAEASAGTR